MLVVEQQQRTHTEAQAGPRGTGHSIGRSGCTSHGTAEMNSMDCSGHAVPAKHWQTLIAEVSSEVTAKQETVPAEQKRGLQLLAATPSHVQVFQLAELGMCVLQYA